MIGELHSQRTGMGHFKEQLNSIDTKLTDLTKSKHPYTYLQQRQPNKLSRFTPPNINFPHDPFQAYQSENSDLRRPSSSIITKNALPTYFYKRQQQQQQQQQQQASSESKPKEKLNGTNYTETLAKCGNQYMKVSSAAVAAANDYEDDFEECDSEASGDKTLQAAAGSCGKASAPRDGKYLFNRN